MVSESTFRSFIIIGVSIISILAISIPLANCSYRNSQGGDDWLMELVKKFTPPSDQNRWAMTEDCKCGLQNNSSERIVGGIVTKPNAWPWMAAVVFTGDDKPKILCGASIINERYLLTAAHCVEYLLMIGIEKFQLYLGTNNLNDPDAIMPKMKSAIAHPKFDSKTKAFDVGLIKLQEPLAFDSYVAPICLTPQSGSPYVNRTAIVSGWGTTMFGGEAVTMQMQAMVNVTSNAACQKLYANNTEEDQPINITQYMLCASAPGSDSCQGDSGGPLFVRRRGFHDVYEQIGVVSFGSGCADSRYPGVYARVGKFLSWIKAVTKDSQYCSNRIIH